MRRTHSLSVIRASLPWALLLSFTLPALSGCSFYPWAKIDRTTTADLTQHPLYGELQKESRFIDVIKRPYTSKRGLVVKLRSGSAVFIGDKPRFLSTKREYKTFRFTKKKPGDNSEGNLDKFQALYVKMYPDGNKNAGNYHHFSITIYKNGKYSGDLQIDYGKEEKALIAAGIKPSYSNMSHVRIYWFTKDDRKNLTLQIDRKHGLLAVSYSGYAVFTSYSTRGNYRVTTKRKVKIALQALGTFDPAHAASLPKVTP